MGKDAAALGEGQAGGCDIAWEMIVRAMSANGERQRHRAEKGVEPAG